ncbi:hypothetical protein SO802_022858 [Lithocarpus litseifolius]|uniref:FRIGIDA-like protein n=1 Tax=Lithocarpus litseifolius TaxID=425828 RepID=A0AAW2C4H3_9ROSI
MPGVIEVLVISGRQNLAFAFELTEQFSPVPLLKSYLKEARKASSPIKAGNTSPTAQNEVNDRELSALKAVLRENPKEKKPEKGRYQHWEPPYYSKQITNLSTKPTQVAKSTSETLTMLRSECYLDQSLQLQRMEAFKIDL